MTSMKSQSTRCRKRSAPAQQGTMYLYMQLQEMYDSNLFVVEVDDSNMMLWTCHIAEDALKHFGMTSLAKQLKQWSILARLPPSIVLHIMFSNDYPHSVPFVRVVHPRFQWHTGHVTIGGSFCTELLTASGWQKMSVDALLQSLCMTLCEGDAKIQLHPDVHCALPLVDYSESEARVAYARVARYHGWM